ncbi:MAG: hypothetical protein AAB669_03135 [Patescibacteria group bacterium]
MIDTKAILDQLDSKEMSIKEFGELLEAMSEEDRRIMSVAVKDNLAKKLKDGSFSREVYERARPAIEADDLARRYDGASGRYRI